MKENKFLHSTQRKLTIIFTLLVFLIATILQIWFFSYKYISWILHEKNKLEFLSENIAQTTIPLEQLNRLMIDARKFWEKDVQKGEFDMTQKGQIMNVVIFDSQKNIILENIRWDIDIDLVKTVLQKQYSEVIFKNNTVIKYFSITKSNQKYQILLFKQLNYDLESYISDMILFFIAIWLFSIIFAIIGYFFVKKNLEPVEKNISEMNDFINNAWHELKTPIAVINSNLQLMREFWEYKEEMLWENLDEINRLNTLIEALVNISNIKENSSIEKNHIKNELDYILEKYNKNILDKNIVIEYIDTHDFIIESNKEYLYILLSNIIQNAIKFSQKWWNIKISFKNNICSIQDYWIWIEKENIKNIFNRFFQEKQDRNSEWFGIWLALVSKISQIYNWKISVESNKNEGTKFIINFK